MLRKTKIYFDTNSLEMRSGDDLRSISQFEVSRLYFDIMNFIDRYSIRDFVEVNIPDIVLLEMKKHLVRCYKSNCDSFRAHCNKIKSIFGSLINIEYQLSMGDSKKHPGKAMEYDEYVDGAIEEFWRLPINRGLKVTPTPKNYDGLIDRAIHTVKPFFASDNGKITDAGFKDALILESILADVDLNTENVILISNDRFMQCRDEMLHGLSNIESFYIITKYDVIIDYFKKTYGIIDLPAEIMRIKEKLESDRYYLETILGSIGQQAALDTDRLYVDNIEKVKNEDDESLMHTVTAHCMINETIYDFQLIYDLAANEFKSISYSIKNE